MTDDFTARADAWLLECFGERLARDPAERNIRFLEEALELVQACALDRAAAHRVVDFVYDRAAGEPGQEVGGVAMTLTALCLAQGLDLPALAEAELARISDPAMTAKIRAKQQRKPQLSA